MNKEKILKIVSKIPKGKVLTYKQVAKLAGNEKAYRFVANILAKNKDYYIPCHRVVKNDYTIGGYRGSYQNDWLKLALLLKEGIIVVMPTDTIYGICGSALKKEIVEKIYKLRKRTPSKPMIILISDIKDLKKFGIRLNLKVKKILDQIWPGEVSVILNLKDKTKIKKFAYLHRRTKSLAFRLPNNKWLINILKISGPLVAPSANWEGCEPAKIITEAKKYFNEKVIYYNKGKIIGVPSTLIRIEGNKLIILRRGKISVLKNLKNKFGNLIDY